MQAVLEHHPDWFDDESDEREPMKPIRLQYVTLSTERALLLDTLERLGLVHAYVGRQIWALNECESNSIRLDARMLIGLDTPDEPLAEQVERRAEALLVQLVIEQAQTVERSVLKDPRLSVEMVAQQLRAQADADLAARGVEIRANIAHAVAEHEAA